jgi:hypothetical protein
MLHILVGAGFTGIILMYCFVDGARYLRSNVDKFLYLISCILQKPLLLPVIMPWRFRSRIAVKHIEDHTFTVNTIEIIKGKQKHIEKIILPTNFLLAIQETNFLYSFTLSGFVASSTAFTLFIDVKWTFEEEGIAPYIMLMISTIYFIYGLAISVFLYGRKTEHLFANDKE